MRRAIVVFGALMIATACCLAEVIIENADLLIRDGKIVAVGTNLDAPDGATIIDGTGAPPMGPVDIVIEGDRIAEIRNVGFAGLPIDEERRPDLAERVCRKLLVDMQPAGGIQYDHVEPAQPGGLHGARGDIDRLLAGDNGQGRNTGLFAQGLQLLLRRRTRHIERRHQNFFLFFFLKALADLGRCCGFTRSLQTDHHDRHRRRRRQVQSDGIATQHFHQMIVDQLDDHLARRNRTQDVRARRLYGNVLDQLFDDRQGDIGLQQRDPQFAHRRRDVGFFQGAALAQPP